MADKSSGQNFEATITDLSGGGNNYSAKLPSFVLDSTMREVVKGLTEAISNADKENISGLKELNKEYLKALKQQTESLGENTEDSNNKNSEDRKQNTKELAKEVDKILASEKSDTEKKRDKQDAMFQRNFEKAARFQGDLLVSAIKGIAVIFGTAGGIMLNSFSNLGNGLRTLTDTGQAFGDQLGEGTSKSTDNIVAMNLMGFTTEEAVSALSQYSRAMSSMGQSTLVGLNKDFLRLSNNGATLGVTLDEASEMFLTDQQFRARTLNRDKINQSITAQLTIQSIQNLRGFSSILGQSADAIRQTAEGIVEADKSFQAFANTLDPTKATELNAVGRSLVEGLIAVFPESGEEFGTALLSTAGTGIGAISEFARSLIPLGGDLYDSFQSVAGQLQSGSLTLEQVPMALQELVNAASMNSDELDRLRVISGLEGPQADAAKLIIQMQQEASMTKDRLTQLAKGTGMTYDTIQETTVGFENIMKTLRGGYSSLVNSIPIGAAEQLGTNFDSLLDAVFGQGGISFLTTELQRAGRQIGLAIGDTINSLAGPDGFRSTITSLIDTIISVTKSFLGRVTRIIQAFERDGKIDFGAVFRQFIFEGVGLVFEAIGLAFSALPWSVIFTSATFLAGWAALTLVISGFFATAATAAGTAFQIAAAKVAASGMLGGGGFMKGAGRLVKGTAITAGIIGGGTAIYNNITAPRDTEYEKKKANRGIGGTILGALLGVGALMLVVGSGGLAAAPLAAVAAGGAGAYLGNKVGESEFVSGKDPKDKEKNKQQALMTSPSMQGPAYTGINTNYLDSMTDLNSANQSVFSAREINKLDQETPETKALALILAENKRLNRQIQNMISAGLKTIPDEKQRA